MAPTPAAAGAGPASATLTAMQQPMQPASAAMQFPSGAASILGIAAILLLVILIAIGAYLKSVHGSAFPCFGGSRKNGRRIHAAIDDEDDEDDDDVFENAGPAPESIKTYVGLPDGQVHCVLLPLGGMSSWGMLSQMVHEACEDSGVPNLPAHGVMHIVLNIGNKPVPVTASTKLSQLNRARTLRITINEGPRDKVEPARKTSKGSRYERLGAGEFDI